MNKRTVEILDTTLRDGAQAEGVSFSVNDKFQILDSLVSIGINYIEAGNPGSNPKDREFFARYKERRPEMGKSVLAAFGSTRRKGVEVAQDSGIIELLSAGTPTIVIFGKAWDVEVRDNLRCSLKENLAMIQDSVAYLLAQGCEIGRAHV